MLGSATTTIVMSSRSMNVVVQTATSVQRRPWAEASTAPDPSKGTPTCPGMGRRSRAGTRGSPRAERKEPAQRRLFSMTLDGRNGPRAVSYEGDGEVGRTRYRAAHHLP